MTYRPTLKSIGEINNEKKGYRPSLSSIQNKNSYEMPNFPFITRQPTGQEKNETERSTIDALKGGIQNFINTPEEAANVFGGHLYNKFNFSPKNKAGQIGGIGGDLASFFLPSAAISGGLKAASLVPKAGKYIKSIQEGIRSKPIVNALKNIGKLASEAALFQAEKNPGSSGKDIAKAGTLGGSLSLAANALSNQNPVIRTIGKLGTGGLLGYSLNGVPGAAEGMAASLFIPKALREIGIGKTPLSVEMLTQEPNPQALAKYQASQRIGDTGTPAEVFNNPMMGARQGEISRSEQGAQAMADFGKQRVRQQENSINSLLKKIFPNTKKANNEISNLYKKAYQHNLSRNSLYELANDPVFTKASENVFNDPAYHKDLKNVGADNYAYLDQVKRAIDDMEQSAIRSGENNKARIYRDSSSNLTKIMDKEVPEYKLARDAAQRRIIHSNIVERLNKRSITGKNFFREFLSNENKFKDILHDVKKIPGAQQDLKDMKLAWDNLIGFDTPATAAGMTAKHTNTAREGMQKFWNEFKDMFGAPRDVQRANFIKDPNWWKKFDEVSEYKNKLDRQKKLGDLISNGLNASTEEYFTKKQKNKL